MFSTMMPMVLAISPVRGCSCDWHIIRGDSLSFQEQARDLRDRTIKHSVVVCPRALLVTRPDEYMWCYGWHEPATISPPAIYGSLATY